MQRSKVRVIDRWEYIGKHHSVLVFFSHLIEDFLEVGGAHTVGQVSVRRMGEEELSLSSHGSVDVLPAIDVLLAPVHHADVTWT